MAGKVSYILTLALSSYLVEKSEGDVIWTRDTQFDDVIKVQNSSRTEERRAVSVTRCACLCTSASWCSSFFFLPTDESCLLNGLVFARPEGGQPSPGARYFKAESAACSSRNGFVWLRGQHTCFSLFLTKMNYITSSRSCTSVGSRLAVLDTEDKIRAVAAYLADRDNPVHNARIGGVRDGVVNGTRTSWDNELDPMYWLNGEKVPTSEPGNNWCSQQPDNYHGQEGCMELKDGQWNDIDCYMLVYFICEKLLY